MNTQNVEQKKTSKSWVFIALEVLLGAIIFVVLLMTAYTTFVSKEAAKKIVEIIGFGWLFTAFFISLYNIKMGIEKTWKNLLHGFLGFFYMIFVTKDIYR